MTLLERAGFVLRKRHSKFILQHYVVGFWGKESSSLHSTVYCGFEEKIFGVISHDSVAWPWGKDHLLHFTQNCTEVLWYLVGFAYCTAVSCCCLCPVFCFMISPLLLSKRAIKPRSNTKRALVKYSRRVYGESIMYETPCGS